MCEASQLVEMTPILPEREAKGETLKHDKELDGYLDHPMIFTDISVNQDNRVSLSSYAFIHHLLLRQS